MAPLLLLLGENENINDPAPESSPSTSAKQPQSRPQTRTPSTSAKQPSGVHLGFCRNTPKSPKTQTKDTAFDGWPILIIMIIIDGMDQSKTKLAHFGTLRLAVYTS